jgi:hypothetical protein
VLGLRLLRNALNGRSSGTDHIPSCIWAKVAASLRRPPSPPRMRPNSSIVMMSNVSCFISSTSSSSWPRIAVASLAYGTASPRCARTGELQDVVSAQCQRHALRLLRRQHIAVEHQLVRRRPHHEHRPCTKQRQLQHWAVPLNAVT